MVYFSIIMVVYFSITIYSLAKSSGKRQEKRAIADPLLCYKYKVKYGDYLLR